MRKISTVLASLAMCLLGALGVAGRAQAQSAPAPYLTASRYQDGGLLVGTIGPAPSGQSNFLATRYTYDGNQRLQTVETGVLSGWQDETKPPAAWSGFSVSKIVTYSYDAYGRKVSETVKGSDKAITNVTQFAYDTLDRLTCTAVRMNPAFFNSLPASACTFVAPGSSDPDRITSNTYDDFNRLIQVRKAVGVSNQSGGDRGGEQAFATYSYTADGLREYIIDADGNRSKLTYDGHGRQNGWYFPSPTPPPAFQPTNQGTALQTAGAVSTTDYESYALDDNGNRIRLKKRDGSIIAYQYDSLNRMWLKDLPGTANDVYYAYDLRGLQTYARFASPSGQGVTNVYDGFARSSSTMTNMGGFSRTVGHGYDADGDRTSVTFPDNTAFTYTYDGADRLAGVLENGTTSVVSQAYYANGLRSSQARGAVATSYSYYADERLHTSTDDLAGTASDVTWTLVYNAANQINSRTLSNNTYALTGHTNGSRSYVPNGLNQYSNVAGSGMGYDLNGNLKSDGSTSTSYNYDTENRLLSVSGTYNATLSYDPLGRLCQIVSGGKTTQFLYDGDELVAEYNGATGALLRRYVHGPGADDPLIWYEGASVSSATRRSLQANYQGSIESVADASGGAVSINRYDDYGLPASSNGGRFQFTGQAWLPEAGVYYYKARLYDPRLGRFLQTDPVGYQDDLALYTYVGNDPTDKTDPTGMCVGACPVTEEFTRLFKSQVDVSVKASAAFGAGFEGKVTANSATATDGTASASLKLVGGRFGASAQATVNLTLGPKDIGDHPLSASLKLGLVGVTVSGGDKGFNAQLSVGPQLGAQVTIGTPAPIGLGINKVEVNAASAVQGVVQGFTRGVSQGVQGVSQAFQSTVAPFQAGVQRFCSANFGCQ